MSLDPVALEANIITALKANLSANNKAVEDNVTAIAYAVAAEVAASINALDGTNLGEVIHVNIDIPLTTLQAQTSGAAFNIGSALPTNARLIDYALNVVQVLAGGSVNAAHITIQNTSETAGAILASTNVFTGVTVGSYFTIGSNPHPNRGGQQLQATVTTGADTMAHLTTGHLSVDLFYVIAA